MQYVRRAAPRTEALDAVATTLLAQTSRLTRLLMRTGSRELSRTEVGLLTTLTDGPRSISDLADTEALAQPSVSKLVDKLEGRGLVSRHRGAQDGRVVLVSICVEGETLLKQVRGHIHAVLRDALVDLPDGDLAVLISAGEVLERLITKVRADGVPG
jgi:DNA-binding MarR family transcriptional regulator